MSRSWYDRVVLPMLIDLACGQKTVAEQRRKVVPLASGRVLEIGLGTGLNLAHYDARKVESITGVDPAEQMSPRARKRIEASGLKVELLAASAERLPVPDRSFDSAVSTYTLCSIPDPLQALKEVRRALKPGGRLFFTEHGMAPDASVRKWQERLDSVWPRVSGGCHLNRDVPALLAQAGFTLENIQSGYEPGPRPWTFHYSGAAAA